VGASLAPEPEVNPDMLAQVHDPQICALLPLTTQLSYCDRALRSHMVTAVGSSWGCPAMSTHTNGQHRPLLAPVNDNLVNEAPNTMLAP
jgi:hypothetical protein